MLKYEIEKILNQEMTRRQFLRSVGIGLLMIIGLPAIIHMLSPRTEQKAVSGAGGGFGYGPYGF